MTGVPLSDMLPQRQLLQLSDFSITTGIQLLLSALIAGLYYLTYRTQSRQASIQETQNQIMSWQTRLMAAEYEPEIRIDDFSAEGDIAELTLSNIGEGRARKLILRCLLYEKSEEQEYIPAFSNRVLGFVLTPVDISLSRLGQVESYIGDEAVNTTTDNDLYRNSIDSHEESIVFRSDTEVEVEIKSLSPVMTVEFSRAVRQMEEKWDSSEFGVDIYLVYEDVIDQQFPQRVISIKDIGVGGEVDLEEAIERGERIDTPVSSLVPDSMKPDDIQSIE